MKSAATVDLCISWRTPNGDCKANKRFKIHDILCSLFLRTGGENNDGDYRLYLASDDKTDRPFDVSVHVIVGSDVVSHCRATHGKSAARSFGEKWLIWKGDLSEMRKIVPDCDQQDLLFKIFVYDRTESSHSQRATAENFLLHQASENTLLGVDSLSRDLEKLLEREDSTADVQLRCGDREFKANGFLLSSRSQVFALMLRSDMLEGKTGRVEIRDTEADIFEHFLRYLYTGKLPKLTLETAVQLYETGDRYRVDALKAQCRLYLARNLAPHNAWDVLLLSDRHSDPDLKDSTISYVVDHRIPLQEDVWQQLSTNHSALCFEILKCLCPLIPSSK